MGYVLFCNRKGPSGITNVTLNSNERLTNHHEIGMYIYKFIHGKDFHERDRLTLWSSY